MSQQPKPKPPADKVWLVKSPGLEINGSTIVEPTKEQAIARLLNLADLDELPEGTVVVLHPYLN